MNYALTRQSLGRMAIAPYADGSVLHDCDSGRLFFLNRTGDLVWRGFRAGQCSDDVVNALVRSHGVEPAVAAQDVERFVEASRKAGLMPCETLDDRMSFAEAATQQSVPEFDHCYRIGDRTTRVVCHVPEVAPSLVALAAPVRVLESAGATSCLTLYRADGVFWLLRDGRLLQRLPTAPLARWALVRELVRGGRRRSWLALMHAGAIAISDGALLISGDSGAGKSTLLASLLACDFPFIADDIVPIEAGTEQVWPVPLAVSVKEGSWAVVEALFPELADKPAIRFGKRVMRYLEPATTAADIGYPIAGAIFPNYVENAPISLTRLGLTDTLVLVGESGSVLPDSDAGLASFLELWAKLPSYQVTYGRLEDAVATICELFGCLDQLGPPKKSCSS